MIQLPQAHPTETAPELDRWRACETCPLAAGTYGTMYGMQKTTVYVPEALKRSLARAAAARGCSEAELIREALRVVTAHNAPPRPRLPLFKSGKPRLAERVEEALAGFGAS
jgi:Ribbon-helix-helix protein, copG family